MAEIPFPLTSEDLPTMRFQVWELMRQIYEEKLGGAELGDVFSLPGDVLTLVLASPSGLTKTSNELAIEPISIGGLQISANGISIKLVATGGLETTASGLGIKLDGASLSLGAAGLKVTNIPTNYTVQTYDTDTVLTDTDLGKIHIMDVSGGDKEFTLPATNALYIGYWIALMRNGTVNSLRIYSGAVGDVILNSSGGGYVECTDATHDYSSLFLIQSALGQWTTPEFGIWTSH